MSKNKGKFHSKDTAAPPPVEEFVSFTSRVVEAVRPHAVKLIVAVVAVAVVLVAVGLWTSHKNRRAQKATEKFGEAVATLRADVDPAGAPKPEPAKPADKDAPPTFKTPAERTQAGLKLVTAMERDYGSSAVVEQTLLVKGGLLFDDGKYDEAITAWTSYLAKAPGGTFAFVARENIGYAREAKALALTDEAARKAALGEAYKAFEQLQPDEKGFYRDRALYHQARVKAALGDKAGAVALYKQILEKFPTTALRTEVGNRVALLEEQG